MQLIYTPKGAKGPFFNEAYKNEGETLTVQTVLHLFILYYNTLRQAHYLIHVPTREHENSLDRSQEYACKYMIWKLFLRPQNYYHLLSFHVQGIQAGGSVVKNSPERAGTTGDMIQSPELGRSPEGGNSNPPLYSCLKISWTVELGRLQSMRL